MTNTLIKLDSSFKPCWVNTRLPAFLSMLLVLFGNSCSYETAVETYFPLENGAVWVYEAELATDGKVTPLRQIVYVDDSTLSSETADASLATLHGERKLYKFLEDGIYFVTTSNNSEKDPKRKSDYQLFLPNKLEIGKSWLNQTDLMLLKASGPWETPLAIQGAIPTRYRILSKEETVVTKTRTFENCLVIEGVGRGFLYSGDYLNDLEVMIEDKRWFAPQVGLVKIVRRERGRNKHTKFIQLEMLLKNVR